MNHPTLESFRSRVEEAIIEELNDLRNAVEPSAFRQGLRVARAILNREAQIAMQRKVSTRNQIEQQDTQKKIDWVRFYWKYEPTFEELKDLIRETSIPFIVDSHTEIYPEIFAAIKECGENGIDPKTLITGLTEKYEKANVIEAIQCALERGKISLNNEGMVVSLVSTF